MGSNKRFRVDVYSGVMAGQNPQLSKREREIQGKFKPEVYDLYHSHTKSKNGIAGDESKIDNRNNMFKGASIKIGLIAMIVLGLMAYFGLKQVATMYEPEVVQEEVIEPIDKADPTLTKVPKVPAKKKGLLNNVDDIVFSYLIKERRDGVIRTTNYFLLTQGTTEAIISEYDLRQLGYKIVAISECLFHLTNDNYDDFVMCNKPIPDKGFFESLVKSE
jgi:zona occludens toxin